MKKKKKKLRVNYLVFICLLNWRMLDFTMRVITKLPICH